MNLFEGSVAMLLSTDQASLGNFISHDVARFLLVIMPILAGAIVCVLILYNEQDSNTSNQTNSVVPHYQPRETPTSEHHGTHRNVIASMILTGFIASMIIGAAIIAVLDYYTYTATGTHLHFDLSMPVINSTGNMFLDLGTLMIVALIAGVLIIVGIMTLAISLKPKPEDQILTRPAYLPQDYAEPAQSFSSNLPFQPPVIPRSHVVCRYCGHEIAHGKYCSECHLTSGYSTS